MDEAKIINQAKTIVLLIKDSKIVYANNYANTFFGYDCLIGKDIIGNIVPKIESSGRDLENLMKDLEDKPETYHLNINENITSRGNVVWIVWSNSLYRDPGGGTMLLSVGIEATDVISRRKKLDAIFNNSLDGIAMIDTELHIIDCNSSFLTMIGFRSKDELFEIDVDETSAFRNYVVELSGELLHYLKNNSTARIQREFQRYDGTSFIADAVYSSIHNIKGEVIGYVINLRDNTDMYKKATTDKLTQIYNRMHFEELAAHEIKRAKRTGNYLSLILCEQ